MKIKRLFLTLTLLAAVFAQIQASSVEHRQLVGKWQYSAPTAPPNYSSGQINFFQDGEKLKGELVIEGQKMEFSQIIIKGEEVAATIYLESTPITIKFKIVNEKLEGSADTPDGLVTVTAVKK